MEKRNDLAVLVLSCDKYADLWAPFFACFFRFWPNCEYPVFLGANKKSFDDERVQTVLTGDDLDWSSSARKIIEQIDCEYVFIILEDLFLTKNVDGEKFRKCFEALVERKFQHCHVNHKPKPESVGADGIGVYVKGMPYRVNVLGLWKKEYLLKMLIDGETPWNFEIMGSYRSSFDDGFFCLPAGMFETINVVEKGRWFPDKLKIVQKMGLVADTRERKVLSGIPWLKSKLQVVIVRLVILIPWRMRVGIMNILRRLFFTY